MQFLSQILAIAPTHAPLSSISLNWIGSVIKWLFDLVGSAGWGIVVFTLAIKLVTLPLDIFSRASTRKNSLKMEQMRPELERLQKQYANDKELYNQKMMALYKKEGYSMFGACLPTLVSLVFFIVVLSAYSSYSSYVQLETFNDMCKAYNAAIVSSEYVEKQTVDGKDEYIIKLDEIYADGVLSTNSETAAINYLKDIGATASAAKYEEDLEGFFWVKNIWRPDVAHNSPLFATGEQFMSSFGNATIESNGETKKLSELQLSGTYDDVTAKLSERKTQANGYYILVVLSVLVTVLSTWIANKSQKAQMELQSNNGQGAATQKMMMWMMPIMIGFFALMYTSAFALYLVINSLVTTFETLAINFFVEKAFQRKVNAQIKQKFESRNPVIKNDGKK